MGPEAMVDPSLTILIVDDNDLVVDTFRAYLEHEGYHVLSAQSGEQALQRVQDDVVDLMLLDIKMPGLSGLEVLSAVRRLRSFEDLPVIMATGNGQSEDMVKAFELGANDYVVKPFDFPVVLARIQTRLQGRSTAEPSAAALALGQMGPGTLLDHRFLLQEPIGKGQFGIVFKAQHLQLERPVAVKVLKAGVEEPEDLMARFLREGRSACRLDHPNAVTVLDFSITEEGIPFLVMEFLEGHSLDVELRRVGRLSVSRVSEILLPVCAVLAEAHASGVIHRDIKPQNIFLHRNRQREVVKVLDFGVAKLVHESMRGQRLTLEGIGPGTPLYMAPERFEEKPYDGRADVYSLGVVMYELFSGHPPFIDLTDNNPIRLALRHLDEEPVSLRRKVPGLPAKVDELVLAALAKDPGNRPQALELQRLLANVAAGSSESSTPFARP